ncbi:hypothetical protein AZE42_08760 [Rhizopogon vesiculosus]|uniref:Uncharacterized protein n=1 Tax=Rhizopogon vesiculosus TaxID=180088 RepID=A0A1J8Q134_9AGAM|nr:hypothetical protein AZE42_08760 [Rhizopogon vesiculosus]
MCRAKTVVKKSSQHKQPCTALKCAKCLQSGQSPARKRCSTLGCRCSCPRFVGILNQQQQKGEQRATRMITRSQVADLSKTTGAAPIVVMTPTRSSSTTSTSTSDMSSVNSSSDEGEAESKTMKSRNPQTGSIPGSLLVKPGVMPLALTFQHCAHAGLPEWHNTLIFMFATSHFL